MNEELYQAALNAINELFGDTSVSKETTRDSLEALRDEIEILLESLEG